MTGVPLVAIRHAPTAWNAERRLQVMLQQAT